VTPPGGAQAERTGLAWTRTALGCVACTLLLLHSAAAQSWGRGLIPVGFGATTSVVLAIIAYRRDRRLRTTEPDPANPLLPAVASLFVTATALSTLLLA